MRQFVKLKKGSFTPFYFFINRISIQCLYTPVNAMTCIWLFKMIFDFFLTILDYVFVVITLGKIEILNLPSEV